LTLALHGHNKHFCGLRLSAEQIVKNVFARLYIITDDIRSPPVLSISLRDHSFFSIRFQPGLVLEPIRDLVAVHVFLETGF